MTIFHDINLGGAISVIIFYFAILILGIFAARKTRKSPNDEESFIVANRSIGLGLGLFTTTATWVGGGFINGTIEVMATPGQGLIWCQASWCYSLSLLFGGVFFAKKLREKEYCTMLDPFQQNFGPKVAALMYIIALIGDLLWGAAILVALGSTVSVILKVDFTVAVIASAAVATTYTFVGGLLSVAYTDVLQLICVLFGVWIAFPFIVTHEAIQGNPFTQTDNWVGQLEPSDRFVWADKALQMMFGGIPWNVFIQRILSAKSSAIAVQASVLSSFFCMFLSVPCILTGIAGSAVDWNKTAYGDDLNGSELHLLGPLLLQYLTPAVIGWCGLGAMAGAVMSSSDSIMISSSAMFSRNIYKVMLRPTAGVTEMQIVMRTAIFVCAIIITYLALVIESIYVLLVLCSDLVYVILFPELIAVVHLEFTTTAGVLAGYFVGLMVRILLGEETIGLPALINLPNWPTRTISMIVTMIVIVVVSKLSVTKRTKEGDKQVVSYTLNNTVEHVHI